jgi:antitoxin ParD1/3/4
MEVTLSPEFEQLIADQVESGRYPSPGEVIRAALSLFREQVEAPERKLETLREDVRIGLEALARGDSEEYDLEHLEGLASDVKRRGRERLKALSEEPAG